MWTSRYTTPTRPPPSLATSAQAPFPPTQQEKKKKKNPTHKAHIERKHRTYGISTTQPCVHDDTIPNGGVASRRGWRCCRDYGKPNGTAEGTQASVSKEPAAQRRGTTRGTTRSTHAQASHRQTAGLHAPKINTPDGSSICHNLGVGQLIFTRRRQQLQHLHPLPVLLHVVKHMQHTAHVHALQGVAAAAGRSRRPGCAGD